MNKSALLPKMKEKAAKVWGAMVFCRDRHCKLCGRDDVTMAPHHWIVNAARSLRGRYDRDNGVILCFTCHRRKVHPRADFATINDLRLAIGIKLEDVVALQEKFEIPWDKTSAEMYDILEAYVKANWHYIKWMREIKVEQKIKNTCTGCGKLKRKCDCKEIPF